MIGKPTYTKGQLIMNLFLMADKFSSASLTSMILVALVCALLPFLFLGWYKAKNDVNAASFFIGMGFYFLFAVMAEGLFNTLIFRGFHLSGILDRTNHPVWYALYGAVVAGIFEETGKYIGLKKCMTGRPGKKNAFLFGVGHGSFEAIAYGSSLFIGNIIIALMVNSFGIDGYFQKLGISGEQLTQQKQAIRELIAMPPIENVAAGVERAVALVFQASLTVFVFLAINHKKLKGLFFIAVILHIIGYAPTYLAQTGILKSMTVSLGLTGAVAVFTAAYAYRIYHQEWPHET